MRKCTFKMVLKDVFKMFRLFSIERTLVLQRTRDASHLKLNENINTDKKV